MSHDREARAAERVAAAALLVCGAIAVANLPRDELPLGWLIAWTVPAALFGTMRQRPQRPWLRALAAALTQIVAFAVAMRYVGALSRPAILACTILPPLAFVVVRRRDADAALGLFLSFCVLLVGVILGGAHLPLLAGYGAAACLSLRSESHLNVLALSRRNRWRPSGARSTRAVVAAAAALAVPCLFAAFVLDRTLAWVPSPLHAGNARDPGADARASARRQQGLDDHFVLGGGSILSDLAGEQLVLVRTDDGSPVPDDLYLRSGFFAVAHLDSWEPGRLSLRREPARFDHVLRRPVADVPVRWLEIERFAGARNFVFAPPSAVALRAVPGLEIDPLRMWLRQSLESEQTDYAVAWQDLPDPGPRGVVDDQGLQDELLALPVGFDDDVRRRFEGLLDAWNASGSPWQVAQRIAAGLAQHCRYDRAEPIGPFRHAIDNFLFAEGDRRGFCMHFASAAALMLRLRGVPCRIGVGLYGGDPDRVEPEARIYGSQHAHAWVEIPYAGRSYVVFDPTPPAERGQRMPTRTDPGEGDDPTLTVQGTSTIDPWRALLDFLTQPWFLALVLAVAIAATMWPAGTPQPVRVVLPRSIQTARRLLVRILRALADAGHLRCRGQTLEQFSAVLADRGTLEPAVAAAFRTYQEVRFGGREFDAAREQALLRGLEAAARAAPLADDGS